MAENHEIIANYLAADATLLGSLGVNGYSGILQGGIWTRPLKRQGFGATPEAFWLSDKGRLVRPSAVILDGDDRDHPQALSIPTAYNQEIIIYIHVPSTATGKGKAHDARRRIYNLIDFETSGWRFTTADGTLARLRYDGRIGLRDHEELVGSKYLFLRYEVTSRHADRT